MSEDDVYWEHFLLLSDIVDYSFAPVQPISAPAYLNTKVEDFLVGFRDLYPDRRLTPKTHYLLHVAYYTQRFVMQYLLVHFSE